MKVVLQASKQQKDNLVAITLGTVLVATIVGGWATSLKDSVTGIILGAITVALVLGIYSIYWTAVLIHEVGHLVAGLLVGLKLLCLKVGTFYLCSGEQFVTPSPLEGYVRMAPREGVMTLRQFVTHAVAGPAASALAFLLGIWWYSATRHDPGHLFYRSMSSLAAFLFTAFCGSTALVSMWPQNGCGNDLDHIRYALNDKLRFRAEQKLLERLRSWQRVPIKSWPVAEVEGFVADRSLSRNYQTYAKSCLMHIHLANLDPDKGGKLAEDLFKDRDNLEGSLKQIWLDAAFITANVRAFFHNDFEGTVEAVQAYESESTDRSGSKLHLAAVMYAKGEIEECLPILDEGIEALKTQASVDALNEESTLAGWHRIRAKVANEIEQKRQSQ